MKKVFAIACLLVLVVSAMALAVEPAAQATWAFKIGADNGGTVGANGYAAGIIKTDPLAKDGFGADGVASDTKDALMTSGGWTAAAGTRGVIMVSGGSTTDAYKTDAKSTRSPYDSYYKAGMPSLNGGVATKTETAANPYSAYSKIWDLRVFNTAGGSGSIRLYMQTAAAGIYIPTTVKNVAGQNVGAPMLKYTVRMINNKGVVGAPANYDFTQSREWNIAQGSAWNVTIPTVHSTTPYFSLTLPMLALSLPGSSQAIAEGYQMQFIQSVPEPGTVAAALALLAPAGFMFRRRRS